MTSLTPAPEVPVAEVISAVRVAPSILAADHTRFGGQVSEVLEAGARVIHCDVMDGHFVPPITFGAGVVGALADRIHAAGGVVDVHLMIERPEQQLAEFARAGADIITVHCEATPNVHYALGAIRQFGCLAGLALNPATSADAVASVAEILDLALCMTVNPGWGGQQFIDATKVKVSRAGELLPGHCAIEVDGGIDAATASTCVERGANLLVAGSAIFGRPEPGKAYQDLAAAAGAC